MTANNVQINTFVKGMDMDTDISMLSADKYRYAENIRVITNNEGTSGAIQNIDDIKKYNLDLNDYVDYNLGDSIIGTTTINQYAVIIVSTMFSIYNGGTTIHKRGIKVLRIEDFDTTTPTVTEVFSGVMNTLGKLKVIADYESDDNIKIYFTDGQSQLKVLNIMSDKYVNTLWTDSTVLDITPGASLSPMRIMGLGVGSLPTGVVQYAYQLFNMYGTESVVSPLTEAIHLTQSNTSDESMNYKGSYSNQNSNKSCILRVNINNYSAFDKIRILRIQFLSNNDTPIIYVVDEIDITSYSMTYTDTGQSIVGEMTIEEFNQFSNYQFTGGSIEKLQNRLFVANVTEDTWDPGDYDARAYRCNPDGKLVLQSTDSSSTITTDNIDTFDYTSVPKDHDCINPYNTANLSMELADGNTETLYAYSNIKNGGKRIPGGSGINIDYTFVYTELDLASGGGRALIGSEVSLNAPVRTRNYLRMHEVETGSYEDEYLEDYVNTPTRIFNYADPYIAANYKSYQRDEVYRFGIVFYNERSIPSPVYWIGDIRMPHASQFVEPFSRNEAHNGTSDYYPDVEQYEMLAKPLGIKFYIKSVPEGAIAYEIVRCDRTEADRTIIMQGAVNSLYEYRAMEDGGIGGGGTPITSGSSIDTRPYMIPEYIQNNTNLKVVNYAKKAGEEESTLDRSLRLNEYVRFISPEVCIQQEDSEALLNNAYISVVGSYKSATYHSSQDAICSTNLRTLQSDGNITSVNNGDEYMRWDDNYPMLQTARNTYDIASMFKYYINDYYFEFSQNTPARIVDAKYPPTIPYNQVVDIKPYKINIGERTYINYIVTSNIKDNDTDKMVQSYLGPAGPCLILYIKDLDGTFGWASRDSDKVVLSNLNNASAIGIVNIKRDSSNIYGGNTYAARANSIYISTNSYQLISQPFISTHVNVFGGDTFMGLLDYPQMFIFQMPDDNKHKELRRYIGCYIPFESSINLNLLQGDMPHMSYTSDGFLDSHLHMDPQQTQTYHSQNEPFFVYNTVYSSQNGSRKFVPKSIYSVSNRHYMNRILVSQAKTANAILDNWTVFKTADYLDVDSQYGPITNLKAFKDRLFYFQDTAVGVASVNERSLINDNNIGTLTLGTGGILTRYDYVSTLNGSSIVNDLSIANSDNVLYWYDYDKNELCAMDNSVHIVSKEKNIQTYLNSMDTKPSNVVSFYDKKYNEMWFSFPDKSLIFNEQLGCFTSFYTFNPSDSLVFSNRVVGTKDNKMYVINDNKLSGLEVLDKDAKIKLLVNQNYNNTKIFDNILFDGKLLDKDNNNLTSGLISQITFNTKGQQATTSNPVFDYREDTYRLPIPRQTIEDTDSFAARLRGKYLECEYQFNTTDGNTFKIPYINTTYRYSLV